MADFGISEAILIASLAATAASAGAAIYQGQAQGQASDYNAKLAEMQAQQARDAAKVAAEQKTEEARRLQATQRALIGSSGVTEEGSPLLVMMDTARQAQLDIERIKYGGEVQSTGYINEARLQRQYARNARTAGAMGAGVSLLSGLASAGTRYARPGGTGA